MSRPWKRIRQIGVLLVLGFWLWQWLQRYLEQQAAPVRLMGTEPLRDPLQPEPRPAKREAMRRPADDLKRIEGIGPKIADLLQTAGIRTFAQLAASNVTQLEQLLTGARYRLANPATWPEQAALAAAGEWEGLKAFQAELRGGRRVAG